MTEDLNRMKSNARFFEKERFQQLDELLETKSGDPTLLLDLVAEISRKTLNCPQVSTAAATALEQASIHFLRAMQQRFSRLEILSSSLCHLRDAEVVSPGSAVCITPIFQEAICHVLQSEQQSGGDLILLKRLQAAAIALLADDESWGESPAFGVLGDPVRQFSLRSDRPRAQRPLIAMLHRSGWLTAACACLLIASFFWWNQTAAVGRAEPLALTFVGSASPIETLGPHQKVNAIYDGDRYRKEDVIRLLTADVKIPNVFLYRLTSHRVALIAMREGESWTFPAEIWDTPIVLPGTGYETFVMLSSSVPLQEFGALNDSSWSLSELETLADSDRPDEVEHLLLKAFASRSRFLVKPIQFARAWHAHAGR